MAENNVEPEHEWSDRALDTADDTLVAMETLLATLRAFEDVLRQQEISIASSTEYCDNFCQALMHYAGSRNSMEHGLPLLEVYCLSINCFAAARSHLTSESDRVALVLKRLALSCFELLLSVPENEISYEAWVQFHHSVQIAHDTLLQYGSTDLQALLQITGEGGAWSNAVLASLLTGQPTNPQEVDAYISLEGEGFMEMRVKHLEKMGEVAKAVVLAKACTECSVISNQATFRQTFVSLLCHLLPNEEAIMEISRLDCKDVLEITCNLETEGEENTAFILCTTFLTQQLQQQSLYCSWELTMLWSKLQKRIDPSSLSLLERCLQLGAIAKTVHHLLCLVRVIQTETEEIGVPASVELCVKALQLPKQDDSESRISVCQSVSCLLPRDLEVSRACLLTEFLIGPSQDIFGSLRELYLRPDQKYDQENVIIPNSLRCELLLALKAYWPFDPEFWDWKTLKYHCVSLLGLMPESEGEGEEQEEEVVDVDKKETGKHPDPQGITVKVESRYEKPMNGSVDGHEQLEEKQSSELADIPDDSETKKPRFCCQICKRSIADTHIVHHSKRHAGDNSHPCPLCLVNFKRRRDLIPHLKDHVQSETHANNIKKEDGQRRQEEDDDIEPGEITVDPSLMQYYESTHDPDVLHHIVQQAKTVKEKNVDNDEHVTFEYIDQHFSVQNREEYPCPGTGCTRTFKHSKYLYVHLKSEHKGDDNVKHFHQVRDMREKCVFCRRHFVSAYHHRKHRRVHYGDRPYTCAIMGCGAQFRTSNELVAHKHTHGYHLHYQCELKDCYVTYSDLGQIYHHEAQHFRDAAFTCSSAQCGKYYLSKKEFTKHLSTHNITFSEEDFEAQRKAKRKLLKTVTEAANRSNKSDTEEAVKVETLSAAAVSCASALPATQSAQPTDAGNDRKDPKTTVTLVAVCFDGSKFTCGFEKCGMTFSRARDVQRHLKCAHPEHLKLENKEHKHDRERSKSKGPKAETEPDRKERGREEDSVPLQPVEGKERKENGDTNALCLQTENDVLREILIRLGKLDLNSPPPHSPKSEAPRSHPESAASEISLGTVARPHVVLIQKKSQPEEKVNVKVEQATAADEEGRDEPLAAAKPYICEMKGCDFRTAQSYSLRRHYNTKHGRTVEQAKRLTSIYFKPYVCKICSKSLREKNALRCHYIQKHKVSETLVDKISCASTWFEGKKDSKKHAPQHLKVWKKDLPKLQSQQPAESPHRVSENGQNLDHHSPSEEEEEESEGKKRVNELKGKSEELTTQQVRTTRRLVAKSNLCYILDKFSKPFHCVAKNCDAAFSTQGGLVRHLQLIHHYNRSQLLLEKDIDAHHSPEARKEAAKKRPPPSSDEPQPQYKCHFPNCHASYHLKSSLARHTRDLHSQPPELIRCNFEGCTRAFSHDSALKKHTLYSHCEYYDSLVVRLQSTHKKSVTGCQKKLIVAPQSPQKEEPARAEGSGPPADGTPRSEVVVAEKVEEEEEEEKVEEEEEKVEEGVEEEEKKVEEGEEEKVVVEEEEEEEEEEKEKKVEEGEEEKVVVEEEGNKENVVEEEGDEEKVVEEDEEEEEVVVVTRSTRSAEKKCPRERRTYGRYVFRPHEEALQMCQDRCMRSAYPCMVQDCDSVVTYSKSLHRHYLRVHSMRPKEFSRHKDELVFNAEQLEELIQRKSARPPVPGACSPSGVRKMEYQAEPENPGELPPPVSLHPVKADAPEEANCDPLEFPEEEKPTTPTPPKTPPPPTAGRNGVLVGAEEVLYGEPSTGGDAEDAAAAAQSSRKPEERLSLDKIKPLLRPLTVDLSPPCSLRFTAEEVVVQDGGRASNGTVAPLPSTPPPPPPPAPVRQPLKRKNELSEPPSNLKDPPARSLSDISAYKPTGFESSFLRFIQETSSKEKGAAAVKRRDSYRRSCSVKENKQLGVSHTRSRRAHSQSQKPHAATGDVASIQNLKSILDKALAGCGDLAIKQLQYLRPVVVLGRPVCSSTLPDLFPPDTTNSSKLLLGS